MVSPITQRLIPAEILTSSHYIFGQIKVIQSGLLGMLTDSTNSYLEVYDASIAPTHKPSSVVNYATQLYMVRSEVGAVCLNKREFLGLHGVVKGGFQRLLPYSVQVSTRTYEISGTLEWAGRFEFAALISEGTGSFISLYDAVLTSPQFPELRIEAPVILLNRNYLQTMIVNKKAPATMVSE